MIAVESICSIKAENLAEPEFLSSDAPLLFMKVAGGHCSK